MGPSAIRACLATPDPSLGVTFTEACCELGTEVRAVCV